MYSPNREDLLRVSIIICTCNRAEDMAQTLDSIAKVEVPDSVFAELVVVDNASSDSTPQLVQSYELPNMNLRYVLEPRRGKGFAYNAGLAAASGEVLLFTDDDVRVPVNWIEGMTQPILSGEADAVAGGVRIAPHLIRPWMQPIQKRALAATEDLNAQSPGVLVGANMAFSRCVLTRVPAFDPELGPGALGFCDDTLFSWQLQQAGFRIRSRLDVMAEHHFDEARLTRNGLVDDAKKHGRSGAYVAYHWEQQPMKLPRCQYLIALLRILYWHFKMRSFRREREGLAWWRRYVIVRAYFHRQWLIEMKRPRNYERRGLTKVSGLLDDPGTLKEQALINELSSHEKTLVS